tara:strand:+ start:363 stop:608 length:246 start_codon:yes stop_codon:yes gene_type:complete
MKDPITGEEKNLTMPGPRRPAENSCRRFKQIGMKNIFVAQNKKKVRKQKKENINFDALPETEQDWVNSLVKNLEVDKNEQQ